MEKNKKNTPKQKIALERIYRLFELAEEMHKSKREDKKELVKRYLSLAKRIGEKTNVSIPKKLKKRFCKNCFSMNIEEKEEKPFLIIKCKDCEFEKKYSLNGKE
jgi:ribonuclease P protein subunit RPR2